MANETESLILEHLRAIRAKQDEHDQRFREVLTRLTENEQATLGLRCDLLAPDERTLHMLHRMDGFDQRLERIEKRLGLIEA